VPGAVYRFGKAEAPTEDGDGDGLRMVRPYQGKDHIIELCTSHDTPNLSERFGLHPALEHTDLETLVNFSEEEFTRVFEGSPLRRPGRAGLARNAALLLGNEPGDKGPDALLHALAKDPSPVVREAAAWSLERAFGEQGLDYEIVMEMDNAEFAKRYVRIGMGIGFCSNLSLESEDHDTLGIVDVDHLFSSVTIGMYTLKVKFQGTSVRNFIDSLRGSRLVSDAAS